MNLNFLCLLLQAGALAVLVSRQPIAASDGRNWANPPEPDGGYLGEQAQHSGPGEEHQHQQQQQQSIQQGNHQLDMVDAIKTMTIGNDDNQKQSAEPNQSSFNPNQQPPSSHLEYEARESLFSPGSSRSSTNITPSPQTQQPGQQQQQQQQTAPLPPASSNQPKPRQQTQQQPQTQQQQAPKAESKVSVLGQQQVAEQSQQTAVKLQQQQQASQLQHLIEQASIPPAQQIAPVQTQQQQQQQPQQQQQHVQVQLPVQQPQPQLPQQQQMHPPQMQQQQQQQQQQPQPQMRPQSQPQQPQQQQQRQSIAQYQSAQQQQQNVIQQQQQLQNQQLQQQIQQQQQQQQPLAQAQPQPRMQAPQPSVNSYPHYHPSSPLYIGHNPFIEILRPHSYADDNIVTLNLSHSHIYEIDSDAFVGQRFEHIDLSNNKLGLIHSRSFRIGPNHSRHHPYDPHGAANGTMGAKMAGPYPTRRPPPAHPKNVIIDFSHNPAIVALSGAFDHIDVPNCLLNFTNTTVELKFGAFKKYFKEHPGHIIDADSVDCCEQEWLLSYKHNFVSRTYCVHDPTLFLSKVPQQTIIDSCIAHVTSGRGSMTIQEPSRIQQMAIAPRGHSSGYSESQNNKTYLILGGTAMILTSLSIYIIFYMFSLKAALVVQLQHKS